MHIPSISCLLIALAAFGDVVRADWTIDETTCGKKGSEKYDLIVAEMPYVVKMAETTAAGLTGTYGKDYYEKLMPATKRKLRDFPTHLKQVFTNIAEAATQKNKLVDYKITCDDSTTTCKNGAWAWNDDKKINFCDILLVKAKRPAKPNVRTSTEIKALAVDSRKFFTATNTVAAIILHEMTHFTKVIAPVSPKQRTLDYAYGYYDSVDLALGKYNRVCHKAAKSGASAHVMCPKSAKDKTTEGVCPEARAVQNADNYKFIAAPTYWSTEGKKAIAMPAARATTKRHHPRALMERTTCPEVIEDDDMIIDWIEEEPTAETNLIS